MVTEHGQGNSTVRIGGLSGQFAQWVIEGEIRSVGVYLKARLPLMLFSLS
jgi:hypothetical protein